MCKVWKKINAPPMCLIQMLVLSGSWYTLKWKRLWFLSGDLRLPARKPHALRAKREALPKQRRRGGAECGADGCGPVGQIKTHLHITLLLEKEACCPAFSGATPLMLLHITKTREHRQCVIHTRRKSAPQWQQCRLLSEGTKGLKNPSLFSCLKGFFS